jgi:hypothetical protein
MVCIAIGGKLYDMISTKISEEKLAIVFCGLSAGVFIVPVVRKHTSSPSLSGVAARMLITTRHVPSGLEPVRVHPHGLPHLRGELVIQEIFPVFLLPD